MSQDKGAIDVILPLFNRLIADAHRTRSAVAAKPGDGFRDRVEPADPIERTDLGPSARWLRWPL